MKSIPSKFFSEPLTHLILQKLLLIINKNLITDCACRST